MSLRVLLISILLVAGAVSGASAADGLYMGHPVYGYSGYSQGGGLYLNVFPYFAGVSLDGRPIGVVVAMLIASTIPLNQTLENPGP